MGLLWRHGPLEGSPIPPAHPAVSGPDVLSPAPRRPLPALSGLGLEQPVAGTSARTGLGLLPASTAAPPVPSSEAMVSASSFTLARPLALLPSSSLPASGPKGSSASDSKEGGLPFPTVAELSILLAFCCISCRAANFMKRRYLQGSRRQRRGWERVGGSFAGLQAGCRVQSQAHASGLLGLTNAGTGLLTAWGQSCLCRAPTHTCTCQPSHAPRWQQVTAEPEIFPDRKGTAGVGCRLWNGSPRGQGSQE